MGKLLTLIGTLIVVGIIAGVGYFAYVSIIKTGQTRDDTVVYGDTVLVNYIGAFENKNVFDTSLWEVATNNISYPKAVSFTIRAKADYQPYNFTIGEHKVIKGWEKGIIGMKLGETKPLTIPKEDAYHDPDPANIKTLPLVQTVPMTTEINRTSFKTTHGGVEPSLNLQVTDTTWGWSATVIGLSGEVVTVTANPYKGEIVHPYKSWDSVVEDIDSAADGGIGRISIRHKITVEMVNNVKDKDAGGGEFRLTGLSVVHNTFTIDYNMETAGKTLLFTVTLMKITRK
jgi:FKBP-type peptidyl-prolyl cis-trans isomerase 2